MTNFELVITSVADDQNPVLKKIAQGAKEFEVKVILIGDRKSPSNFSLSPVKFYSLEEQRGLPFKLAKLLPENHYSRKNLGYLIAIEKGYEVIVETDDDNIPMNSFWRERNEYVTAELIENAVWVNVYNFFTDIKIWPRGYPIELLQQQSSYNLKKEKVFTPIQQGLADLNPDVDAIYRMTGALPIKFKQRKFPIALGKGSYSPFNSQNTTWFKKAFPLMYLPSYCSFRMTDIWRSFVAQRIAYHYDWKILFHNASVFQKRNEHNLLRDFEQEIPGYLNNAKIMKALLETDLLKGEKDIYENLFRSYKVLVKEEWIEEKELFLLEDWIDDLIELGL